MKLSRSLVPALCASLVATAALTGVAPPALAQSGASVSVTPSAVMPYVTSSNSTVEQIVQCGSTMYAVGSFTQIGRPGGLRYARRNAFSFNAVTGAVSAWNPDPNGTVLSVAVSPRCAGVYLAGSFTTVGGVARADLAEVSPTSGALVPGFLPAPNKTVDTVVQTASGILMVGGEFTSIGGAVRSRMASLNPTSGAATGFLNLPVTGKIPGNSGVTRIVKVRLSPDGTRATATGVFSAIAGQTRSQVFMLDIGGATAKVDAWNPPSLSMSCNTNLEPFYVRASTWSPDSSRVYLATTGVSGTSPLCDAAAAFSSAPSATLSPIWVNKTGCDSLYAVAADASTVYVGGHERYIDNPNACNKLGAGGSDRPGVGAISPSTGHSVAWNPTRSRGHGAGDLLRTSAGLWVASDTYLSSTSCGGKFHPGICFFPNG